jgi:hypothetical protein
MIKSGGSFLFKGMRCVIGAIILIKGRHYIACASHIFHGTGMRSRVQANGAEGIVSRFLDDFDIALIELPPGCTVEGTELGSAAVMEDSLLVNEYHSIPCRVIRAGVSLLSLLFPCSDMPQPGDSGSPIQQDGKVIGILSSVMLSNCTGTAVSSEVLRSLSI